MFYFKTTGIILNKKNVKEKSAVIYILTKNLGLIKAIAEGINRSESKLLSVVQPGNYGKIYLIGEGSIYKLLSFLALKIPNKVYKKYPYTYLWALKFLIFFNFFELSDRFFFFVLNMDKILIKSPAYFPFIFLNEIFKELGIEPNIENCYSCNIKLIRSKEIYLYGSKLFCEKCKKIGYEKISKEDYLNLLNFLVKNQKPKKINKNILKKIFKSHLKSINL